MEASSGNDSKSGWVLLLGRRDQKHAYSFYQVLGVEQVSVNAKEGGNDYCIYLGVEQVYYT